MTQSGKRPLEESSASSPLRRTQQDFYSWLQSLTLEKLQELYRQYTKKNEIIQGETGTITLTQEKSVYNPEKIVLRRSVFRLVTYFIAIEFLFDLLYIMIRIPFMYITIPVQFQGFITALYFFSFVVINIIKVFFISVGALRFVTSKYEIAMDGIRFKYGIISRKEKTFVYTYMQEVTFSQDFWGRVFNFGTIEIYNPAVKEKIILDSIPNPSKYAEIIKKNLPVSQAPAGFINVQS